MPYPPSYPRPATRGRSSWSRSADDADGRRLVNQLEIALLLDPGHGVFETGERVLPDLAPEILRPRPSRVGQAEHRRREIGPLGVSGGSEEESCERQSYRQRLRGSEAFHVIN